MCSKTMQNSNYSSEIETLLKSVAVSEGFKTFELNITSGSVKGDGYLGNIKSVQISGLNHNNLKQTLDVVIKCSQKNPNTRQQIPITDVYKREILIYSVLFPLFKNLELEHELNELNTVKFYTSHVNEAEEFLILENIKESGYKLHDRTVPMDEDHVKLIFAQYGFLHALGFVMRERKAEALLNMSDIQEKLLKGVFKKTVLEACQGAIKSLNPKTDGDVILAYKAFLDNLNETFKEVIDYPLDEYCTVLHVDCWNNNMMFKYEDVLKPTKPTKACLLDFQISNLGPPILDLAHFFFTCSSDEVTAQCDKYLDFYYETMSTYMRKLGSDPNKLYSKSVFLKQWRTFSKVALFLSPLLIRIMLSEAHEVIDFDGVVSSGKPVSDAFNYELTNEENYNSRIRNIVLYFYNNNLLK